ncbi:MAG: folylpolyglutamate synthase/dihydrofolate synthase family protein [Candidatus Thermoplasmatota archaeon]|nr:folylpolyglutamate synthase/dihydrofolate synthase family protein [Candidatus Thermoplasmatota archaeon]
MDFKQSLEWLYDLQKFGIKPGLERIKYISNELGNPQNDYQVIHVGGTNGKGSVCRYLEQILTHGGYNVGLYTSPHLTHVSERVVVGKKEISESELILLVKKLKPIVEKMIENGDLPTFFEVLTAIAFQYFKEKEVDFAIIEVGLGGRFDATNIVKPTASVITNISLEHQDVLGNSIEKIALEKAGIIKDEIPVITATTSKAFKIIEDASKRKNSFLTHVTNDGWEKINAKLNKQEFLIKSLIKNYSVETSMLGTHQGENIAIAIGTIENLQMNGTYITNEDICNGIKNTVNHGRMEIVSYAPLILIDGAHNPAGIDVLKNALKNDFDFDKLILVLGILSDKDIGKMVSIIVPMAHITILTKSKNNRACKPSEMNNIIKDSGFEKEVVIKEDITDAVEYAKKIATKKDLICITGSLFTVGEAREHLVKNA